MYNNKTLILGIDSSKRSTGVALITHYKSEDNKDIFELYKKVLIKTKSKPGDHLFQSELDSYEMMKAFLKDDVKLIDYAALEGFAFGGRNLTGLSATAAMYQLIMAQEKIPLIHIAPKRVKLIVAETGNATKQEVKAGLKNYLINYDTIVWPSFDVTDAAAIAISSAIVNLYPERFEKKIPCPKKKILKPSVQS